jgi:transcription elongation factor Elf1
MEKFRNLWTSNRWSKGVKRESIRSPIWIWFSCKSEQDLLATHATCLICGSWIRLTFLTNHLSDCHSFQSSYDAYSDLLKIEDMQFPLKNFTCLICGEDHLSKSAHYNHVVKCHGVDGCIICDCGNSIRSYARLSLHKKHGCSKVSSMIRRTILENNTIN